MAQINLKYPTTLPTATLVADASQAPNGSVDSIPTLTQANGQSVSAALEIQSTLGALLLPRMTQSQRLALNPFNGMMVYDLTNSDIYFYVNGVWVSAGFNTNSYNITNWTDVTAATQTIAVLNGYTTDRSAGVTYTLPATAVIGNVFIIDGKSGITTIAQNANQQILIASASTTVGVTGSIVASTVGCCITLRCITGGASTVWRAESLMGNWNVN